MDQQRGDRPLAEFQKAGVNIYSSTLKLLTGILPVKTSIQAVPSRFQPNTSTLEIEKICYRNGSAEKTCQHYKLASYILPNYTCNNNNDRLTAFDPGQPG